MARPYKGWSVFWRGDKRRWVLSRDGKQKLLPAGIKNKREAVAWATKWLTENGYLEADGTAKRSDDVDLFSDLADRWIKWRESLIGKRWESATVSNNKSHVKQQIKPGLAGKTVAECTPRAIAAMLDALTCAPNSKRNIYRTLIALFDDCIEQGFCDLDLNPAKASVVERAVPDAITKVQEAQANTQLSESELLRVTSDPRVPFERRVKYTCAVAMVARDGEVMGLSRGAIDFDAGLVRITQTSKIRRYATDPSVGKPKSKRSRRTIPLHPAAAAALKDWIAHIEAKAGHELPASAPIFPGKDGGFTRIKAAAQFRDDLDAIGIPSTVAGCNLVFHHLRHTALNILRRKGVDQVVRDHLSGHAPKNVDDAHYQHSTLDAERHDVELLPLVWAGPNGRFDAHACASVTETDRKDDSQ